MVIVFKLMLFLATNPIKIPYVVDIFAGVIVLLKKV